MTCRASQPSLSHRTSKKRMGKKKERRRNDERFTCAGAARTFDPVLRNYQKLPEKKKSQPRWKESKRDRIRGKTSHLTQSLEHHFVSISSFASCTRGRMALFAHTHFPLSCSTLGFHGWLQKRYHGYTRGVSPVFFFKHARDPNLLALWTHCTCLPTGGHRNTPTEGCMKVRTRTFAHCNNKL